jgi:dimethylhistidine N-methyltransferase
MAIHWLPTGGRSMTCMPRTAVPIAGEEMNLSTRQFRADVLRGLRAAQKELPCKYFYDERGSHLFDQICKLDEYYLTRTELAILRSNAPAIADRLGQNCLLVEFGSGSALKTRVVLDHLVEPAAYVPIDVAHTHLERSARALADRYPGIEVLPVCADFTGHFDLPRSARPARRRVIFFPGSTIGNFGPEAATELLGRIAALGGPKVGVLVGVDLEKDASLLEPAYNDRQGITAAFNLNLLARINRELAADFPLDGFRHHAFYNRPLSRIEMHLISLDAQTVHIGDCAVAFEAGETIRTECSYKYSLDQFQRLAATAGLQIKDVWTDPDNRFSVQYLELG